ncbi:hypothetical protein PSU4_30370 [Pseudonocardia sulfidoxydans NBRC 16205]|uniref:Uncharacterized protein n=1 Tax=Pseudonocardia sulfidoxydans NBRC 16205 TaxID=1223511 RepID=A0A511DIE4_9PSEU|nr:hypothetical protein [Pseudonocardia sulfidoxydans]GEL24083.1 hypothetical protein PSU4_30370 [Pseudonocardia sulfidoxydans NBRC 16205]
MQEGGEDAPSAADALAIIQQAQSHASSRLSPSIGVFYLVWGISWVVIGLAWFLAGIDVVSVAVSSWVTGIAVVGAACVSAAVGIRTGRGVSGPSSRQGLWYGLSWPISMSLLGVLVGVLGSRNLPGDTMSVIAPALYVFLAGALYMLSGAVWSSRVDYVLGIWIMVVAVVSAMVGLPASPLIIGLGGGGALLFAGVRAMVHRSAR